MGPWRRKGPRYRAIGDIERDQLLSGQQEYMPTGDDRRGRGILQCCAPMHGATVAIERFYEAMQCWRPLFPHYIGREIDHPVDGHRFAAQFCIGVLWWRYPVPPMQLSCRWIERLEFSVVRGSAGRIAIAVRHIDQPILQSWPKKRADSAGS